MINCYSAKSGDICGALCYKLTLCGEMVIFFKDPLSSHAHESDVNMLIRVCDVHNIPLATNEATAQLLLNAIAIE